MNKINIFVSWSSKSPAGHELTKLVKNACLQASPQFNVLEAVRETEIGAVDITTSIRDQLQKSHIILADISANKFAKDPKCAEANSNVMLELGEFRKMQKWANVILVNASPQPPPFDVCTLRYIKYVSPTTFTESLATILEGYLTSNLFTKPLTLSGELSLANKVLKIDNQETLLVRNVYSNLRINCTNHTEYELRIRPRIKLPTTIKTPWGTIYPSCQEIILEDIFLLPKEDYANTLPIGTMYQELAKRTTPECKKHELNIKVELSVESQLIPKVVVPCKTYWMPPIIEDNPHQVEDYSPEFDSMREKMETLEEKLETLETLVNEIIDRE